MRAATPLSTLALFLAACTPARHASSPASPASTTAPDASDGAEAVAGAKPPPSRPDPDPPKKRPELPRGGRELFPAYRLVGYCGTPGGGNALGRLHSNLPAQAKKIAALGEKYAKGRQPLPVFELIATIVMGAPGADGKWRRRVPDSAVDEYLKEARAAKAILLLNIQAGHSDFITEVKHFEKYLKEPDVGLALDPEWSMSGKQKPGVFFGQTTGAAINEVAAFVQGIIEANDLPEKAIVYHQVNNHVVKDENQLVPHPGIALIKGVDGLGPKAAKIVTYNFLVKDMPSTIHAGFKLFFDEDTTNGNKLMTPEEVLALTPEPEYVMYE